MYPKPCGVCGSDDLRPMWQEGTNIKWILCKACGNASGLSEVVGSSEAVSNEVITQWNREQKEHKK